ncbi:MAG: hypothetical protein KAT47_03000 [Candidatus Aegiribacteria sp.]|nr:hypothetical protein [Candidatus Aegiribacteria sp.]
MKRLFALLGIMFFFAGCGRQLPQDAAIMVGSETVSKDKLASALEPFHGDSQLVNLRVESIINRLLILQDAQAREFDTRPEFQRNTYAIENKQLRQRWLERILDEKVELSEDTVEEYYSQLGTMVSYTSITLDDSILCDSLRQLVLNGHDMGDLVEQFSIDSYEIAVRGIFGPVDLMRSSSEDFKLLQGLEAGDVSLILAFDSNWKFLQIESIFSDSVPPFEDIGESISRQILGNLRDEYRLRLEDSLVTVYDLRITSGVPELIAEHAIDNAGNYEPYSSEQEEIAAYTFTGGERSLLDLVEDIRNMPVFVFRTPSDHEWVESYCRTQGLYDMMAFEARKLQMDTLPEILSIVGRQASDELLDVYYSLVIEPGIEPTSAQLLEMYEDSLSNLIVYEKRTFKTIGAIGEDQLETLHQIVSEGEEPFNRVDDLTPLVDLLAPDETVLTNPLAFNDIPAPWNEMLFGAELFETVFCSLSAERVLVFKVEKIIPEHQASFDESRESLLEPVRVMNEEKVVSGLVDSLRSVYHIQLDRNFIDGFIYADSLIEIIPSEPVSSDSQEII